MPVGASQDLDDEPGELPYGHMTGEAVVIDPVRAVFCMLADLGIG